MRIFEGGVIDIRVVGADMVPLVGRCCIYTPRAATRETLLDLGCSTKFMNDA